MTEVTGTAGVLPDPSVVASWTPEFRAALRAELDAADSTTADTTGTAAPAAGPAAPAVDNVGAVSNDGTNVVIARPFGTSGIGLPVHEAINVAAWILHHAGIIAGDVGLKGAQTELDALLGKVEELSKI